MMWGNIYSMFILYSIILYNISTCDMIIIYSYVIDLKYHHVCFQNIDPVIIHTTVIMFKITHRKYCSRIRQCVFFMFSSCQWEDFMFLNLDSSFDLCYKDFAIYFHLFSRLICDRSYFRSDFASSKCAFFSLFIGAVFFLLTVKKYIF